MNNFKVIIFDLDGVIFNSIKVMKKAFYNAYENVVGDGQLLFDEYLRYLGSDLKTIIKKLQLPNKMIGEFIKESYNLTKELVAYDGMEKVLRMLSCCGFKLGVATGKEGVRARYLLDFFNLSELFDLVVGGDEVRRAKPDPEIILKHIKYFNVLPEEILFVGDSIADLQAGSSAGVKTAAALWGYNSYEELIRKLPDFILKKPYDLVQLVIGDDRWQC